MTGHQSTQRHLQPDAIEAEEKLTSIEKGDSPQDVYNVFNEFAKTHFGAETDDLIYEKFGDNLEFVGDEGADGEGSVWTYASGQSATVAFETNLPADAHVEYRAEGESNYRTTATRERPFYVHLHHLTDLEPGTTHEWRPVAVDERGNVVKGPLRRFETREEGAFISITPDDDGPIHIEASGDYVLAGDLDVDRTGIEIHADDVTLDLGGHTVTYAEDAVDDPDDHFPDSRVGYTENGFFGVKNAAGSNFTLVNGRIAQGETLPGENRGHSTSVGFNPLYLQSVAHVEVAGVEVDYHSPQNSGIRFQHAGEDVHVHHNLVRDRGTEIDSRGGAAPTVIQFIDSQPAPGPDYVVNHNLIPRARQMGIFYADTAFNNELYGDCWSTNGFLIAPADGVDTDADGIYANRLFATGFNPYGIGWVSENLNASDNLISMFGLDLHHRWHESWGDINLLAGMRITNYDTGGQKREHHHYWNNLLIMRSKGGAHVEGTRLMSDVTNEDVVFRDNVVKAEVLDEAETHSGAIVTHGQHHKESAAPVYYRNNRLLSNVAVVRFGEPYAVGHNHRFVGNTIERIGDRSEFHTFVFDGGRYSWEHVVRDTEFESGTSFDDVYWEDTGWQSTYSVEWTLQLQTPTDARVAITNSNQEYVFTADTEPGETVEIPLTQCVIRPVEWEPDGGAAIGAQEEHQKLRKTPHTVTVTRDSEEHSREIEMTEPRRLKVTADSIERRPVDEN